MEKSGNDFLTGYVEHLVPLKEKSILLSKKIKIALLGAVLCAAVFGLSRLPIPSGIVPVLLVGIAVLLWYLWQFTSVEYEYTIVEGEMEIEVIYGKSRRKHFYTVPRGKFEKIAKVNGKEYTLSDFPNIKKEVFCASTRTGENTCYAIVAEEGGNKALLFFEMTPKAEKALRTYHRSAFTL